ncbi:hypothetical protein POM88_033797 [Heracleum sosnowskyi]|uniref:Uncharacterized protein n=1 Tax=Heracleum sosnowskyi TaxID=360622 RepID=A0AAD8HKG0_9APIA|nr:hypothetical protein POM88_033797 [Heracleum sosnowskyi]
MDASNSALRDMGITGIRHGVVVAPTTRTNHAPELANAQGTSTTRVDSYDHQVPSGDVRCCTYGMKCGMEKLVGGLVVGDPVQGTTHACSYTCSGSWSCSWRCTIGTECWWSCLRTLS